MFLTKQIYLRKFNFKQKTTIAQGVSYKFDLKQRIDVSYLCLIKRANFDIFPFVHAFLLKFKLKLSASVLKWRFLYVFYKTTYFQAKWPLSTLFRESFT